MVAVGLFFGARYALGRLNRWVAQYSETNSMSMPAVQLPAQEMQGVLDRVAAFSDAIEAHRTRRR